MSTSRVTVELTSITVENLKHLCIFCLFTCRKTKRSNDLAWKHGGSSQWPIYTVGESVYDIDERKLFYEMFYTVVIYTLCKNRCMDQ